MKHTLILAAAALSACSTAKPVQDRPVIVNVPVSQPCVGERPLPPTPLARAYNWDAMDVRQKAAAVAKQALEWQTYGEQLNAATGACE